MSSKILSKSAPKMGVKKPKCNCKGKKPCICGKVAPVAHENGGKVNVKLSKKTV